MNEFTAKLDVILDTPDPNWTDLIAWSREAQAKLTRPKADRKAYMREYMRKRRAKPESV